MLAPQKYRVNTVEWHKMGKYNIFPPETRVELIEGEIIKMVPIGPTHAGCVIKLNELFANQKGKTAFISVQNPIQLDDFSEPEPDLVLVRPASHFYRKRHPTTTDILLLIEVSDSTVKYDRDIKIPLYARERIVECWLVNLDANCVEVYLNPTAQGYINKYIILPKQILIPSQLPHIKIPASDILND